MEGSCIYCAQLGHFLADCPARNENASHHGPALVSPTLLKNIFRWQCIGVTLTHDSDSFSHPVLVDSGADANFMDKSLAAKLQLASISLDSPASATVLNGLLHRSLTYRILSILGSHSEEISFHCLWQLPSKGYVNGC